MITKDLTTETASQILDRINALSPDSQRAWGTMTVEDMVKHLRLGVQASIGELEVEDNSNLVFKLLRPLLFSGILPKPKGKAPAPNEYLVTSSGKFDDERDQLVGAVERFVELCDREPDATPLHPLFGNMTIPQWQRGHALHFDHHLEQFGV